MNTVKITIELPVKSLADLQAFLLNEFQGTPSADTAGKGNEPAAAEPDQAVAKSSESGVSGPAPVTKTMIRAKGLELVKADKQAALESVFEKFGVKNLSALPEDKYEEAYRLMEAL